MRPVPYARSRAMFSAIAAALAAAPIGELARMEAVRVELARRGLPFSYRSRGKGRGTPSRNYGNVPRAELGQGMQERLRRLQGGWYRWNTQGCTKSQALGIGRERQLRAYELVTGERLSR